MKKRLSILLVIVMVFAMMATVVGCDSDKEGNASQGGSAPVDPTPTPDPEPTPEPEDEEEGIVGKWEAKVSVGEALQAEVAEFADFIDPDTELTYYAEFDEDGDYEISMDEDEMVDFMKEFAYDMLDAIAQEAGMSVDEVLESEGYTLEEFEEELMASMDMDDLTESGSYEFDDDEITLENDVVWTIEFKGSSKFELVDIDGEEETGLSACLPVTFEK